MDKEYIIETTKSIKKLIVSADNYVECRDLFLDSILEDIEEIKDIKEKGVDVKMEEDRLKKLEDRIAKLEKSQEKAVDSLQDMFAGVGQQMQSFGGTGGFGLGQQEEKKKDAD